MRRGHTLAATTGPVSWTLFEADDFNAPRIDLVFGTAPTSAGLITVTKQSVAGAAYNSIVSTVNPVGRTSVSIETLHGFVSGDKLLLEYANPDSVSITGTASLDLPLLGDLSTSGVTADNGLIRSLESKYRRIFPLQMGAISPGASGANWQPCDANAVCGWRVDTITEMLYIEAKIFDDWDSSTNPVLEATYTVMEAGTDPSDVFAIEFGLMYNNPRLQNMRSQSIMVSRVVGAIPQYTIFNGTVSIPIDVTDNEISHGDVIGMSMNISATSDITDIRINAASFSYPVTHVGIESSDVL